MTDGPLEPEDLASAHQPPDDDWSPEPDTGPEPELEPWAWIDEAVDAWDSSFDVGDVASGLEGFDEVDEVDDVAEEAGGEADGGVGAPGPAGEPHPTPVDLHGPDALDEAGPDDDLVAAPLPGDQVGLCPVSSLVETLALAGIDPGEIFSDFGADHLEARQAVSALDLAGVPARVEYTDLGELLERLAAGVEVVLGAGAPHAVVAIDPVAGEMVVEPLAGGDRTVLSMDAFESAWEETANEMMVVNADDSGILLGTGEVCVLPVHATASMGDGGL